jgi:hypothetical protein
MIRRDESLKILDYIVYYLEYGDVVKSLNIFRLRSV